MKPYSEYRDTAVAWAPRLPKHWGCQRLKFCVTKIGSGKTPGRGGSAYTDSGVNFIRSLNVYDTGFRDGDLVFISEATDEEMSGSRARRGDVLLNITGASIGRCCVVPDRILPANVNQHVCLVRPSKDFDGGYLAFVLQSVLTKHQIRADEQGSSREGLNFSQVGNLVVPFPGLAEQAVIATALGQRTKQIDAIIAKKQALSAVLARKRQVAITTAVTKGLRRGISKASGFEWIGAIPCGWTVKRLKFLVDRIDQGWSPQCENRTADDDEWAIIKLSAVSHGAFIPEEHKALPATAEPDEGLVVREGDLLITRANTPELVGDCCVVVRTRPRLMLCDLVYRVSSALTLAHRRFICYFLISDAGRAPIEMDARGSSQSMVKLSQRHLACWPIPVPPADEIESVVAHLDALTTQIDAARQSLADQIERLRVQRLALITAAVTGQIDLRTAATQ